MQDEWTSKKIYLNKKLYTVLCLIKPSLRTSQVKPFIVSTKYRPVKKYDSLELIFRL